MNIEEVKAYCQEKTKYSFMTANLCNNALSEMYFLRSEHYEGKVQYLLSTFTIRFFNGALQYMFNAEYCKLFEVEDGRKDKNMSSLLKLNNYHFKQLGKSFRAYDENIELIENVLQSDFFKTQRQLRDTRFAHSDLAQTNDFTLTPLTNEEFDIAFQHIKIALTVINNCNTLFGTEYYIMIPNEGTTTKNVLRNYTEYQTYYFKNALGSSDEII